MYKSAIRACIKWTREEEFVSAQSFGGVINLVDFVGILRQEPVKCVLLDCLAFGKLRG